MEDKGKGKVWLVGAGPGDAELLTLKGRRVLEEADVVVYDRLAGPGLLSFAPDGAELIDAGKSGGCHTIIQEEIEKILIEKAAAGKKVVRLKGGDPFLFGRGGEEMAALMERGIACELVPGVTSPIAVPAYAGIPVTRRGCASSVHIVTAHEREGGNADLPALARLDGTLIFLMGASRLRAICEGLAAAGMDAETPAAVIENGTTARQRQIFGTLASLPARAEDAGIQAPSVIVVGKVAAPGKDGGGLDWRSALPLAGRRVAVPVVLGKSGRLAGLLRRRGAEVIEAPVSRTEPAAVSLPPLGGYGWLVFTSAEGVDRFFERLKAESRDIREIGRAKIAAVGPATGAAVEARGLRVALTPSAYDGAALGQALLLADSASSVNSEKERLLLLRAEDASPELPRVLRDAGLSFDEVPVYRTVPFESKRFDPEWLEGAAVAFTCASSVRNFRASITSLNTQNIKAVCIGERTAAAARQAGFETHTAANATLEDLANAVERALFY